MSYGHELTYTDEGGGDDYVCTCGERFPANGGVHEAFEHGQSSVSDLSTVERMVYNALAERAANLDTAPDMPSLKEIDEAIDSSQQSFDGVGYLWDAISDMVYDQFPQFREPDDD